MDNSPKTIRLAAVIVVVVLVMLLLIFSCSRRSLMRRTVQSNPQPQPYKWHDNCPSCINEYNVGYKDVRSTYVDDNNNGYNPVRSTYIQWPPLKGDTKFGNPPGKIFPMEDTNLLNRNYDNVVESDGYNTITNSYFDVNDMNDTYMFTPRAYKYYLQNKEGI